MVKSKSGIQAGLSDRSIALILLIPSFFIAAVLIVYPLVRLLSYSLFDIKTFSLTDAEPRFVFLANFVEIIQEKDFLLAYITTGDKAKEVPDWFDDEFEAVVNNWKVSAEF